MKQITKNILVLMLLFNAQGILATNYYASNQGNNNNDGLSPITAFETLQYAITILKAGDKLSVLDGNYTGFNAASWKDMDSGTSTNPITIQAEGDGVNIITPTNTNDGINIEDVNWIILDGFRVLSMPRNGIRVVDANHVTVKNNYCDNNFERGIFSGCAASLTIVNNTCLNSIDEHGIYVSNSADNHIITGNTCMNNNGSGIQVNADLSTGCKYETVDGIINDVVIRDNILIGNGDSGGAAINLDGVEDVDIFNNVLVDNHATGIALFKGNGAITSNDVRIYHNTVINATDGRWCILLQNGAVDVKVKNNIIINNHPSKGAIGVKPSALVGFESDYNTVINRFGMNGDDLESVITLSAWQNMGYDIHSFVVDNELELFVDFLNNDYQLKEGTSAIDAGIFLPEVTIDLAGNMRPQGNAVDLGAYEYGVGESFLSITVRTVENVLSGTTVLVPVDIELPNNFSFESVEIELDGYFNQANFNNISTENSLLENITSGIEWNEVDGVNKIAAAWEESIGESGTLFWLKLEVPLEASGFIPINLRSVLINDGSNSVQVTSGGIEVAAVTLYGDVDLNGSVQALDATYILKYLASLTELSAQQMLNADVDSDNEITMNDIVLILQYLVGLVDELPFIGLQVEDVDASGTLSMDNQTIEPGQMVEIPIVISENENVLSFEGDFIYDSNHLDYQNIIWSNILDNFIKIDIPEDGHIHFIGASGRIIDDSGIFATLRFLVKEDFEEEKTIVSLNKLNWNNRGVMENISQAILSNDDITSISPLTILAANLQAFPNPFSNTTTIHYELKEPSTVELNIYDVKGQLVRNLEKKSQSIGKYTFTWNGNGRNGKILDNGIYYYQLIADKESLTKRIVLLKE